MTASAPPPPRTSTRAHPQAARQAPLPSSLQACLALINHSKQQLITRTILAPPLLFPRRRRYGIILFALFSGRQPFAEQLAAAPAEEVVRSISQVDTRPTFPEAVPKPLRDLAIDCWLRRPQRRPRARELGRLLRDAVAAAAPSAPAGAAAAHSGGRLLFPSGGAGALRRPRSLLRLQSSSGEHNTAHSRHDSDGGVSASAEALSVMFDGSAGAAVGRGASGLLVRRRQGAPMRELLAECVAAIARVTEESEVVRVAAEALARIAPNARVAAVASLPPEAAGAAGSRRARAARASVSGGGIIPNPPPISVRESDGGSPPSFFAFASPSVSGSSADVEMALARLLAPSLGPHVQRLAVPGGSGGGDACLRRSQDGARSPGASALQLSTMGPEDGSADTLSVPTSLESLLATGRTSSLTSTTARAGISAFADWAEADAALPLPDPPGSSRHAWSALARSGGGGGGTLVGGGGAAAGASGSAGGDDAVGFVLVLWDSAQDWFEVLSTEHALEDIRAALGGALARCRAAEALRQQQRDKDGRELQRLFLRGMSHELRTARDL